MLRFVAKLTNARVWAGKVTAAAVLAGGMSVFGGTAAQAAEINLISKETGFVLTGELVSFDGSNYVIDSSIGKLTVGSDQVTCEGPGCPNAAAPVATLSSSIGVYGSNMIGASLMPGLIEAYSESLGSVVEREIGANARQVKMRLRGQDGAEIASIDLRADGSANAFPGLISGQAAIGMSSRQVSRQEITALERAGIPQISSAGREHVLALDGLIVVVSQRNPLRSISAEDLADVFSGAVNNWAALGGPDAPINVYMREPGSGAHDTFSERVLAPRGLSVSPNARIISSARRLSDSVAQDPNGVGVTGIAYERNGRALAIETSCGLVVEPSEFNVKTEEYPLTRRLYLYTSGAPLHQSAKGLLDYSLSDDAQGQIADLGFVNQEITTISLNQQGRRITEAFLLLRDPNAMDAMRELAQELLDAVRLSTTIRFQSNSTALDVKSSGDLSRLARRVASGALDGKEVVLIGFADDSSEFAANVSLSQQRSIQIRAEFERELASVGALGRINVATMGYGDLAPVACNNGSLSQASNRRVEVWVRERL
ncbi:MAG: phosphate ABC transporter substrate-binding/OmpA family protein [Pikeienuella sp.]